MAYSREQLDEFRCYLRIGDSRQGFPQWACEHAIEPKETIVQAAQRSIRQAVCISDPFLAAQPPIHPDTTAGPINAYSVDDLARLVQKEGHANVAISWAIYALISNGGLFAEVKVIYCRKPIQSESPPLGYEFTWDDKLVEEIAAGVNKYSGLPPDPPPFMGLVIAPTPALREAWLKSLGGLPETILSRVEHQESQQTKGSNRCSDGKRPCYDRDHELLDLELEATDKGIKHFHAYALEEYNKRHPEAPLQKGRPGRNVVKEATRKARKERPQPTKL